MSDQADVYRGPELVGRITRTRSGSVFEYEDGFYEAHAKSSGGIAYHLPYSRKKTETRGVNVHPYFAGLLPEGLRLRALIRRIKTSEDDLLSLLMASGEDAIGDISVIPAGRQPGEAAPAADLAKLDQTVFSELFEKSIGQEASAPEPTIPGVQQKLSAAVLSFPLRGRQKQRAYILKLNPPDKPRLVENEEFFLRAARDCGLVVPSAKIIQDRTVQTGLLIERFDRLPAKKREELTRVHQEDACQFLDRYPADKYRITCSEIAEGLSLCSAPVIETAKLIRLIAFSYLIGNGDLHAKNVSIHTSPQSSRIEMTPAYDLVTTYPYGDTRMALKFEGRDDNFRRRYFLDFGVRYGVREPVTKTILDELVEAIEPWIRRLGEIGFAEKKTKQLEELIRKRREDLGR